MPALPPSSASGRPDYDVDRDHPAFEVLYRQQEALAHGLSHDLRAPLRAISGYARVLAEGHAEGLDAKGRGYVERIRAAAARMDELIESLLQLSHVARAPIRSETVDIGLLVEWRLAELQDAEPDRQLQLQVQPGVEAVGDERLLGVLFARLVDNAWRFTPSDRPVQVTLEGRLQDGRVQVSLRDAGIGFDPELAGRIFEPFQRLHAEHQGAGDGIGLAVAQGIVVRHGGRLWAESEPGRGSVFHIELPAPRGDA